MIDIRKILLGTEVTKVTAGGSNGSIILLDFKNDSNEEFVLFLYCTWRITHANNVIGTAASDINDDTILSEIKNLKDKYVIDVTVNKFNDISLYLSDDYQLDVFCDNVSNPDMDYPLDNWKMCDINENKSYVFNSEFKFTTNPYR
ncbi:hypothetical protein E0W68_12855 [Flavobacterium salilacus subsp. salilacus]|uniref:hypothetical protein n=1 Tax=Flavobacterium TaxID=237 RepID=UPI001074D251|nr:MULTISPECIES: hypothetical protein [Flavobacterium]KAF2515834.1 hypothetical protein E0W68_12855 [Flavobacterium salilacus subsp. salilacus]MBE1615361.1 hypothetical protein [Flavobacterium sp. SaA2.13]